MRRIFDCYDYCLWSLGSVYDFRQYVAPTTADYMPDLETLIANYENEGGLQ